MDALSERRRRALLRSALARAEPPRREHSVASAWSAPDPAPKAHLGWLALLACAAAPALAIAPLWAAWNRPWIEWAILWALAALGAVGCASAWACSRSIERSRRGRELVARAAALAADPLCSDAARAKALAFEIASFWRALSWSERENLWALEACAKACLNAQPGPADPLEALERACQELQASQTRAVWNPPRASLKS